MTWSVQRDTCVLTAAMPPTATTATPGARAAPTSTALPTAPPDECWGSSAAAVSQACVTSTPDSLPAGRIIAVEQNNVHQLMSAQLSARTSLPERPSLSAFHSLQKQNTAGYIRCRIYVQTLLQPLKGEESSLIAAQRH